MTDNDDPAPPRASPSSNGLGKDPARDADAGPKKQRAVRWSLRSGTGVHVAPTDPEVPSAKRRGALRRQRSQMAVTAVVMGLLSITLALLYRASQGVGMRDPKGEEKPAFDGTRNDIDVSAPAAIGDGTLTRRVPAQRVESGGELADDAPADDQTSTDSAPAGSASPALKSPAPALDIIRTPAF